MNSRVDMSLRQLARWEARRPSFEQALLTSQLTAYAIHRLRYFGTLVIFRSLLLVLETWFFLHVFQALHGFWVIVIVRYTLWLGSSLIWGGLEPMRARIRAHSAGFSWSPSRRRVIRNEVESALSWALLISGGGLLLLTLSTSAAVGLGWIDGMLGFVILTGGFHLAVLGVVRTYHAGLFALQRVYVPMWAFMLIHFVDVFLIVTLWSWLGSGSFAVALLLGGSLWGLLLCAMSRKGYRIREIPGVRLRHVMREALRTTSFANGSNAIRFALASGITNIDTVLFMALIVSNNHGPNGVAFGALLYLIRPFSSATHEWARLFYFDMMKLRLHRSVLLEQRFRRLLSGTALTLAFCAWVMSAIWAALFEFGSSPIWLVLALGPFFALRSLVALRQIQAFANYQLGYLMKLGGLFGTGGTIILLSGYEIIGTITALGALFGLAVILPPPPTSQLAPVARSGQPEIYTLPRWLTLLKDATLPLRIGTAEFSENAGFGQIHRIGGALVALPGVGAVCLIGSRRLTWFDSASGAPRLKQEDVILASCGIATSVEFTREGQAHDSLIREAVNRGMLGPRAASILQTIDNGPGKLREDFRRLFPEGVMLDPRDGQIVHAECIGQKEFAQIAYGAPVSGLLSRRRLEKSQYDVMAYAPGGEPRLVFLIDRRAPRDERGAWRRRVNDSSLRGSLSS